MSKYFVSTPRMLKGPHWWSGNDGVETMAMQPRDDMIETCWSKYSLH